MTISSVNQNPGLPNLGTQGTTAQGLPAQPSVPTNTGGAAPTSATPAVVFGQELDSAAVHTYDAQGILASDNIADAVTAGNYMFATGQTSFLQVYEDASGNTVAKNWQQSSNGYVAGPANVLGAWVANAHFLVGDVDGNGRAELVVIAPNQTGGAVATIWTTAADGSMASVGTSNVGNWASDTRYLLGNGDGSGKAGLWEVNNPQNGNTNVTWWASTGSSFVQKGSTTASGWQADQR
ncbi:MAG: hypothetical protein JO218_02400, partial [Burkholderiales bacterium]|nr:hypothetical protein [Burkholderiales bacterium]